MSAPLRSCLYEGAVHHRRMRPAHSFRYRVFMAYLDLAELDGLDARLWPVLSGRRAAPARFRRGDYYGDPDVPLADSIRGLLAESDRHAPARVALLTNLRTFGSCFNPVSFYYCFDQGDRLQAVVADVTNTPWGERHAYVLDPDGGRSAKRLHVSPFLDMEQEYECRAQAPGETTRASVSSRRDGETVFEATLLLRRRELTRAGLARMLARYPLQGVQIRARIYSQALRLRLRGARYFPHPGREGVA